MSREPLDIAGQRFGRLVPIEIVGRDQNRKVLWRCACDCGSHTTVTTLQLTSGNTKSCGCIRATEPGNQYKHGMSHSPEHDAWAKMRERCTNPKNRVYAQYGGRGIRVAKRWESFAAFLRDVGERPGPGWELQRKNPDGNFTPSNVRWGLRSERPRRKKT